MAITPTVWYLIIKVKLRGDNEAIAFSEGISGEDAIRNYRAQSKTRSQAAFVTAAWPYERTDDLVSYPTERA